MFETIGKWASGAAAGTNGIIAGVVGGIQAGKKRKQMSKYLDQQMADNQSWYNANALSDYTQRADSQALMKNLRDNLKRDNKRAENMSVVTGATPEQQAVQKEQSNKVLSDTFSKLGAMGQQWKDNITDRYLQRKDELSGQRMNMYNDQAKSWESLAHNGFNTLQQSFLSIAGS